MPYKWRNATFLLICQLYCWQERKIERIGTMMHGVKSPLAQFCRLVQENVIPGWEVRRLVAKYSGPKQGLEKVFEQVLQSAREAVKQVADKNIKASARVVIAGFSHRDEDIDAALESVGKIGNGLRCQTLATLVKTLAEAGRVDKAWKIVPKIGEDQYWVTMAILFIACVTNSPQDFGRAKIAAMHVKSRQYKEEAFADIAHAQNHKANREALLLRSGSSLETAEIVNELVKALIQLNDFDDAHRAALKIGSASIRIDVLASIGRALSQLINPHLRKK